LSSPNQQIAGLENVESLSFDQAAHVMQETIYNYAAAVQPGLVGGPVVIRVTTQFNSRWWGTTPEWPHWTSFADLAEDYASDRVAFHLMPGVKKEQLDDLIGEGAAWVRVKHSTIPTAPR
jgi:hypothetical protein